MGDARSVGRALYRRAGDRGAAAASRCWRVGGQEALDRLLATLQPLSLVALLATLVLLFGFQGEQIMRAAARSSRCWRCRS